MQAPQTNSFESDMCWKTLEFTNDVMQVVSPYILIQNFKNECFRGFYFKRSILNNYVKFNEMKPCKRSRQTLLKATCVGKH